MSSHHSPDDEEQQLWQTTFDSLLNTPSDSVPTENSPPTYPLDTHYPCYHISQIQPVLGSKTLQFIHPSLSLSQSRRALSQPFKPELSVDLHHLHAPQAYQACQCAIAQCLAHHLRRLRLICGQGHHANGLSLLKGVCLFVLNQSPSILAFETAHPSEGGTGAINVFLINSLKNSH